MEFSENLVIIVVCIVLTIMLFGGFVLAFVLAANKKVIEKQNQLFEAVLKAQESEQQRVGRDLHDGIGPLLTLIKHHASELKDVELMDLTKKAISGVRAASHNLSPPGLGESGLLYALKQLAINWTQPDGLSVDVVCQSTYFNQPTTFDGHLYRIVSELVQNAVKHGRSSVVLIHIFEKGDYVLIQVQDDGVGMTNPSANGLGLKSAKDRMQLLQGQMEVHSEENEGTRVVLTLQKKEIKSNG